MKKKGGETKKKEEEEGREGGREEEKTGGGSEHLQGRGGFPEDSRGESAIDDIIGLESDLEGGGGRGNGPHPGHDIMEGIEPEEDRNSTLFRLDRTAEAASLRQIDRALQNPKRLDRDLVITLIGAAPVVARLSG